MSKTDTSPPRRRGARLRQGVTLLAILVALAAAAALLLLLEWPAGEWHYPGLGGADR